MPARGGSTGPRVGDAGAWGDLLRPTWTRVCGPDRTGSKRLTSRRAGWRDRAPGGSLAGRQALRLDGLVAGAQDPHPADAPTLGAVVRLLLDQVVAAGAAHAHPVGDVLALRHPAGGDRAQLKDVGPGPEPVLEDDLLGHLLARGGLPVPPWRQGLEIDRVGQQRAQRRAVLGRQSPRKVLTCSNHRGSPAAIVASRALTAPDDGVRRVMSAWGNCPIFTGSQFGARQRERP